MELIAVLLNSAILTALIEYLKKLIRERRGLDVSTEAIVALGTGLCATAYVAGSVLAGYQERTTLATEVSAIYGLATVWYVFIIKKLKDDGGNNQ